jgi:hypothetical protein
MDTLVIMLIVLIVLGGGGVGIRSVAAVAPRWPSTFPEHRALGVAGVRVHISSIQGESG